MSKLPRWYRQQLLERKSGINSQASDYWDIQHYQNVRRAITETLDEQDRGYKQQQRSSVDRIKRELTSLSERGATHE